MLCSDCIKSLTQTVDDISNTNDNSSTVVFKGYGNFCWFMSAIASIFAVNKSARLEPRKEKNASTNNMEAKVEVWHSLTDSKYY